MQFGQIIIKKNQYIECPEKEKEKSFQNTLRFIYELQDLILKLMKK